METLTLSLMADSFAIVEATDNRVATVHINPQDFYALMVEFGDVLDYPEKDTANWKIWGSEVFLSKEQPRGAVTFGGDPGFPVDYSFDFIQSKEYITKEDFEKKFFSINS